MKFVGKSIIEKEQLQSKKKFGVFDMEIQLYGKDFSNDIKDMYKEIIKANINVVSIHAPLRTSKRDDFNLEFFTNPEYSEIFIKTCKLAQLLANYYNHKVNIIIHNGISLYKYILMPCLFN